MGCCCAKKEASCGTETKPVPTGSPFPRSSNAVTSIKPTVAPVSEAPATPAAAAEASDAPERAPSSTVGSETSDGESNTDDESWAEGGTDQSSNPSKTGDQPAPKSKQTEISVSQGPAPNSKLTEMSFSQGPVPNSKRTEMSNVPSGESRESLPGLRTEEEETSRWNYILTSNPWGDTSHTTCVEYRIRVPLSLVEFEKAQIYAVTESATKGGVEVLCSEPFGPSTPNNPADGLPGNSGMYSHKVYRLKSVMPMAIRGLISDDMLTMEERAWTAYPLAKTNIVNRRLALKDHLVQVSTLHVEGGGPFLPNALQLPSELLYIRKIIKVDITDDAAIGGTRSRNYKKAEDPKRLRLSDGRGPFLKGWEENYTGPQIVVYKVVALRLRLRIVEGHLRSWATEKTYPAVFARFYRLALCSYSEWSQLSVAQLREREAAVHDQIRRAAKSKSGTIPKNPSLTLEA